MPSQNSKTKPMPLSEVFLMDCMEYMKNIPDKFFDLAVVDPPYGDAGGESWKGKPTSRFGGRFAKYKIERTGGSWSTKYQQTNSIKHWDTAPPDEYFEELFRVSNEQIIWGGNYFGLPPNRHFLIWEKETISEVFSMAMVEYAWSSFNTNAKLFKHKPQDSFRFHPTQKPVKLYRWLLQNYAQPGDKIFDSHLGSQSSRIAAYDMGFDFYGCELDPDYFAAGCKRFEEHKLQLKLL